MKKSALFLLAFLGISQTCFAEITMNTYNEYGLQISYPSGWNIYVQPPNGEGVPCDKAVTGISIFPKEKESASMLINRFYAAGVPGNMMGRILSDPDPYFFQYFGVPRSIKKEKITTAKGYSGFIATLPTRKGFVAIVFSSSGDCVKISCGWTDDKFDYGKIFKEIIMSATLFGDNKDISK